MVGGAGCDAEHFGWVQRRDTPPPAPRLPTPRGHPTLCSPSPDDLARPSAATSEEQTEGQTSTLECSTPYVCPLGDVALRWEGYDPQVSVVSSHVQLDTSGVGHHLTLTTSFSWKDHSKKLLCEVSYGSRKAIGEVALRVRRTWGGSARGLAERGGGNGAPLPQPHHPGPPPAAHCASPSASFLGPLAKSQSRVSSCFSLPLLFPHRSPWPGLVSVP